MVRSTALNTFIFFLDWDSNFFTSLGFLFFCHRCHLWLDWLREFVPLEHMRLRYCNLTCVYVIFRKFINGNGEWKRLKVHWSIISFPFSRFQGKKRNTNLVCFFYPWAELLCLIKRINLKMQTHNIKWIHFFLLHFHLEKMHITCMKYEMFIQQFWYFLQTTKNKYVIKEKSIQPRLSFFLRLFFCHFHRTHVAKIFWVRFFVCTKFNYKFCDNKNRTMNTCHAKL